VRFVRGRYGDGKTHLMAMAGYLALQRSFVVSYVSAEDTRIDKLEEVYKKIVRHFQTADLSGGIEVLLSEWRRRSSEDSETVLAALRELPALDLNFRIAVQSYLREDDEQKQDRIAQWLRGEPITLPELGIRRYLRAGDSQDMMRSLSVFLRFIGYKGLVVLLDELDRIQYQSNRIRQSCYQVLRELMDNVDGQNGMQGTLFYCAAPSEMFTADKGFKEFDPLRTRLEPATNAVKSSEDGTPRTDYRATIINLENTLRPSDIYEIATRVREIHGIAFGWDAAKPLPDSDLKEVVDWVIAQNYNISTPRIVATAIATIADLIEQGEMPDKTAEIKRAHDMAEESRAKRHREKYQD
jgi:hypothetical protein